MNYGLPALVAGFNALLGSNGEDLIFRSSILRCVVNRNIQDRVTRSPDFDLRDNTEIRFIRNLLELPRPGEEFVDNFGYAHRVQNTKTLGDFLTCRCLPSTPEPDVLATEEPDMLLTDDPEVIQAG